MKLKKFEILGNKIGLTSCIWSCLNAQGTENPESHSGWEIPFSHFQPPLLWGYKNWPQYESEEVWKFGERNWLNRLQMVQFECPRH